MFSLEVPFNPYSVTSPSLWDVEWPASPKTVDAIELPEPALFEGTGRYPTDMFPRPISAAAQASRTRQKRQVVEAAEVLFGDHPRRARRAGVALRHT